MPKTPDEDDDVIVHWCSGAWEIRLGDELHGLRFTLTSALERACDVAAVHRRPGGEREFTINARIDF